MGGAAVSKQTQPVADDIVTEDNIIPGNKVKKSQNNARGSARTITVKFLGETDAETVVNVIRDPEASSAFLEFLKKEFCEENLLFFQAVDNVLKAKASEDPVKLKALSEAVIREFILPGSKSEVNISQKLKTQIGDNLKSLPTDDHQEILRSLKVAQSEVVGILTFGAFPRFLQSEEYETLLEALEKDRQHGVSLAARRDGNPATS